MFITTVDGYEIFVGRSSLGTSDIAWYWMSHMSPARRIPPETAAKIGAAVVALDQLYRPGQPYADLTPYEFFLKLIGP